MKKISFMLLFLCGVMTTTFAQSELPGSSFLAFLHGGYGILPNKTSGLTNDYTAKHVDKLSSGATWNAQAYYRNKLFIVGMLYSGYTANGSLKYSSDKILTTYVAPQLGMCIPAGSFDIGFNAGVGSMWYRNNGLVYEKDRIATATTVGVNLCVKGVYNFSQHFGVSLEVAGISANLSSLNVKYHDETSKVNYTDAVHLSQITFSLGLKYSL